MEYKDRKVEEKLIKPRSGFTFLLLDLAIWILSVVFLVIGCVMVEASPVLGGILISLCVAGFILAILLLPGLKVVGPNEALVLVLFGNYYGTIVNEGFYFVNPFCTAVNPTAGSGGAVTAAANGGQISLSTGSSLNKKVSLKTMTLNNDKQKVNDILGNPVEVGAVVIWRVINPTKAVLNVNNYKSFLSIQCDSIIRNTARLYPYDLADTEGDSDEKTLRGSSQEISDRMKAELQERVEDAGLEIMEVRITHLAYAPEIAAAMLQRQQAVAIIAARQKIVEGAVGMVEMALNKLSENQVVELDDERKAAMVSNLLVVLCGNKDAQPIVNSGTIY